VSSALAAIADAVLFEGYLLYPYSRSALKNQKWWPFGVVYPRAFCEARGAGELSSLELECLLVGGESTRIEACLRFLEPSSNEPVVREMQMTLDVATSEQRVGSTFERVSVGLSAECFSLRDGVLKLRLRAVNETRATKMPDAQAERLAFAMASCQFLLTAERGSFVSLTDPPESLRDEALRCKNTGIWPVLVEAPVGRSAMLAAPIILPDFARVAPESSGDFFDGTEIDELLRLRVVTLTTDEKRELAEKDSRARALLDRTEQLCIEDRPLNGRMTLDAGLVPGRAVRLRPSARADIFDLALAGKSATIASLETSLEGEPFVVVTVDEDPGKDLGPYGHRFFFRPEEVELL
jgi:hypothetical protein